MANTHDTAEPAGTAKVAIEMAETWLQEKDNPYQILDVGDRAAALSKRVGWAEGLVRQLVDELYTALGLPARPMGVGMPLQEFLDTRIPDDEGSS